MSQRLSLDRGSFKRFLSALFQQMQRQGLRGSAGNRIDPQGVPDLIQIGHDVNSGRLDLNAVIRRLVRLTQRVVGAGGAGVWLFAHNEIFYCAGAGNASNDERLRLEVISKLAASCHLRKDSLFRLGKPTPIDPVYDTSPGPGWAKSLLVEPIYQGHNIAGALAAFSDELNSFTERDAANIRLIGDVLAQALSKAAEAGLGQSVALEPAAALQLIEHIIPALLRMLDSDESAPHSTNRLARIEPQHDLPTPGMETKSLQESHESGQEARVTELVPGTWTEHEPASPTQPGNSPTSPAVEFTNVPRVGLRAALKSKLAGTSTLWPVVRQKCDRTIASVRNHVSRTFEGLRLAASWLLNRAEKAGHQVWRTARYPADSPPRATLAAYRDWRRVKASISSIAKNARNRLWAATESRKTLLTVTLSKRLAQRDLRPTQDSFLQALKSAHTRLQTLMPFRPHLRGLGTAVPGLAILLLTIMFLTLKTGLHHPAQTTASSSRTSAQERIPLTAGSTGYRETPRSDGIAESGAREAHGAEQFGTSAPLQVSHVRVTDRTTEDAIRTLSRYELAGLRRRAEFGDDSAAFQIGMAYEIGHGVPQSCTTAARWVARAAGEGNAPAQYNLGLRYRDGDGVPVNGGEAVKWLQKAASQQSSGAQLALTPLTTRQARFVGSRP